MKEKFIQEVAKGRYTDDELRRAIKTLKNPPPLDTNELLKGLLKLKQQGII